MRDVVKKISMHTHFAYCRVRTTDCRCRFGYGENQVKQQTSIDETCNRVVYRRRKKEDLRVVHYNAELTKKNKYHIIEKRTQGGGSIAYLMKYTFKRSTKKELELTTNPDQDSTVTGIERGLAKDIIRNDLRLYMRVKVTRTVEAVWKLLEFRYF